MVALQHYVARFTIRYLLDWTQTTKWRILKRCNKLASLSSFTPTRCGSLLFPRNNQMKPILSSFPQTSYVIFATSYASRLCGSVHAGFNSRGCTKSFYTTLAILLILIFLSMKPQYVTNYLSVTPLSYSYLDFEILNFVFINFVIPTLNFLIPNFVIPTLRFATSWFPTLRFPTLCDFQLCEVWSSFKFLRNPQKFNSQIIENQIYCFLPNKLQKTSI